MNNVSEQLLQAMDIIVDQKISKLEFDKTIQATIYSIVNLDIGEYKVKYNGNIFSVFNNDSDKSYKINDSVYVTVPEGNFSNRKIINGLVNSKSLYYTQLTTLQNTIFEISPTFDVLYGGNLYDSKASYGIIAGKPEGAEGSYIYIYNGPEEFNPNGYHGLFQQYANQYDLIRIQASFLTQLQSEHNKGKYGIQIEFYAKSLEGYEIVSYTLDLNSFNGDPYNFSVYSPQYVIIKTQKNYLLGLKSIKLFEKDFEYDRIIENGLVTDKKNVTAPNIFVKDISLQYVDKKDLSDTNYYLTIVAPTGIAFTQNISTLDLVGRLIYQGKDIMDTKTCKLKWFSRDLDIMIGNEEYDKDAGFGWKPLPQISSSITIDFKEVGHSQRYKLLAIYNDTVQLTAEIELFNHNNNYSYSVAQHTNNASISLQLVNEVNEEELIGDWFLSYPDGTYLELSEGKKVNSIVINDYLKYSSVIFYCQVYDYDKTNIIGTIEYTVVNSESSEDVTISYTGEDTFRYDANGDIAIEDTEKERTLQVNLTWKEGFGTAYSVSWYARDSLGKEIPLTDKEYEPEQSMIDKIWIDNSNILHYNIKQKYKVNFNNNTLIVKIKTITEEEYKFNKEILFLKDGDQGTNGTTYVLAIRPCDNLGLKLSGFNPLIYNQGWKNNLPLRCYVYKDGELINGHKNYIITYKWQGINVLFTQPKGEDQIQVSGNIDLSSISVTSASKNLQFYVKVQVDIDDKMNNRETSIYASYPIDVAVGNIDINKVNIDTIPSYIKYTASGVTPQFYNNDINFIYEDQKLNNNILPLNKSVLDIEEIEGLYYLKPASSFIFENLKENNESNIGILKLVYSNSQYIIHPIIMYLDVYGNEAINGWDGTSLQTNEKDYLFAPQIGAGGKDSQNRFTGVVMGKDSVQKLIGLYGYQAGVNTFGLLQDGRAYFGAKAGGGQILLDGRFATITGGDVTLASDGRVRPAANGMYLVLADRNNGPAADQRVTSNTKAIGIGYNSSLKEENFYVTYDGKLKATEADIQGKIYADSGQIGGNGRSGGWTIEKNRIFSGSGTSFVALDTDPDSYFRIWAGRQSPGTSYNPNEAEVSKRIVSPAPFVVTKDGFVYMQNAWIKGRIESSEGKIANWIIKNNKFVTSDGTVGLATTGRTRIWVGADKSENLDTDPTFKGSSYFYVDSSGKLFCQDAMIKGRIECEEGIIGGWKITEGKISNGDTILRATGGRQNTQVQTRTIGVYDDFLDTDKQGVEVGSKYLGYLGRVKVNSYNRDDDGVGLYGTADVSLHAENSVNFKGRELYCTIPAEQQRGLYARFA